MSSRTITNGTRGAKNGAVVNRLDAGDRAAHDWYRFVLSYPPHLVRDYLERFGVEPKGRVLDPFCGTGTTLVECKKIGVTCAGIEAHPLLHFASEVKIDWTPDPGGLLEHAEEIAASARRQMESAGIDDDDLPLLGRRAKRMSNLRALPEEAARLLVTDTISPLPLHKTLVLLDHLKRQWNPAYSPHELLALAKTLVTSIGNLNFGPEVGVGRIKRDTPVIAPWLANVRQTAEDLGVLQGLSGGKAEAWRADAREPCEFIEPASIDAVITSPPYPNEKDYTRTTRLESVLLGFVKSKADLRALKQGLVRSNTRGVYQKDTDDRWIRGHPKIERLARQIEARRIALGKTSGFERRYAKVTRLYFGGMARHLAQLRNVLRPGARLAYVVGDQASYLRVMIRTGRLLAGIARSLGYEVLGIDLFRTRLATATRKQLREEVVVLRWSGENA